MGWSKACSSSCIQWKANSNGQLQVPNEDVMPSAEAGTCVVGAWTHSLRDEQFAQAGNQHGPHCRE